MKNRLKKYEWIKYKAFPASLAFLLIGMVLTEVLSLGYEIILYLFLVVMIFSGIFFEIMESIIEKKLSKKR
ncbi:MAG: hypothetical protein ACTSR8_15440 [Promethearchaeota archaeon]